MRGVVLAAMLVGGCTHYEDRLGIAASPADAEAVSARAWSAYGTGEAPSFSVIWLANGDCSNGRGFMDWRGECHTGEYLPTENRLYLIASEATRATWWKSLCHEFLHAAIDVENGPELGADDRHTNVSLWFWPGPGTLRDCREQVASVIGTTQDGAEP